MRWLRWRRVLKFVGTVLVVLLAVILVATFKWRYVVYAGYYNWNVVIVGGGIQITHFEDYRKQQLPPMYAQWFHGPVDWNRFRIDSSHFGLRPRYSSFSNMAGVVVPLWLLLAIVAVPTAWLWYADRRRPAPGACRCGYDLTGNTSGICPECATPTGASVTPS